MRGTPLHWGATGVIPYLPDGGVSNETLNSSTEAVAFGFTAPLSTTLDTVQIMATAIAGTGGTCQIALKAVDSTLRPTGSAIETKTCTPVASTWVSTTGWTASLTKGTAYALEVTNTDGTPATNYPTFPNSDSSMTYIGSPSGQDSQSPAWHWSMYYNGTAWSNKGGQPFLVKLATGDWLGMPTTINSSSARQVYSDRALTLRVPLPGPPSLQYRVTHVQTLMGSNGNPAGVRVVRVWPGTGWLPKNGNSRFGDGGLLCRSQAATSSSTAQFRQAHQLPTPVWMRGGSTCVIEMTSPNSSSVSNCYRIGYMDFYDGALPTLAQQLTLLGMPPAGWGAWHMDTSSTTDDWTTNRRLYAAVLIWDKIAVCPARSRRWH